MEFLGHPAVVGCLGVAAGWVAVSQWLVPSIPVNTLCAIKGTVCGLVAVSSTSTGRSFNLKALMISAGLGAAASTSMYMYNNQPSQSLFWIFSGAVASFHFTEYLLTAIYNRPVLSLDSFLLNHSTAYGLAMVGAVVEFWVEWRFFPWMKQLNAIALAGLVLVVSGDVFRKLAMATAASNFKHLVAYTKRPDHVLVTSGVYSWFRHPSYAGWFWWSVGSQILLCNPICTIGFALASYRFFEDRIYDEEFQLVRFFGKDYVEYQQRVSTGVPFVRGNLDAARLLEEMVTN
eukprot:m.6138 g.6138  ORF g.6138 m.6138 type:complete len:289 (-) comp5131_c0_seq1:351-1217(-)